MVIAQALGEYGLLSSVMESVRTMPIVIEDYIRNAEPTTIGLWILGAFVIWYFVVRMR